MRPVNDTQLGRIFRAVRIQMGVTQEDVARRARVSQSTISRIERGHIASIPVQALRSVGTVLEIRLDLGAGWRGGDLARIVNARHTALHHALAVRLDRVGGWESAPEVTFAIYGERGVIDRLAYHPGHAMLAIFELNADLLDPAELVAQVDRYRRLAPTIAASRGWHATDVSAWVLVADTSINRSRLAEHRTLIRGALPGDGRTLAAWLRDPAAPGDGLAFLSYPHVRTGVRQIGAVKRVLPRRRGGREREMKGGEVSSG
jgi:transcriptional regulator with XRE-family HTH domain